jgi:hypothetical protein
MATLLAAMALLVVSYYYWPAAASVFERYSAWQQSGGVLAAALASGIAGGIISEVCLVYVAHGGRWTSHHVENLVFKFGLFFIGGSVVYEFYRMQAGWFGDGVTWNVILPKVLVDQFVFSVFWSTTYQTVAFRWQSHRYSIRKVTRELNLDFVVVRMLPILVTNWMFWIPGVILLYSLPLMLQMPLGVFANAIWAILLSAVARHNHADGVTEPELVPTGPSGFINSTD